MSEIIYNETKNEWEYRQMLRSPYVDYFNGLFFVTFQTYHNKSVFGAIIGEECVLNELGEAVKAAWLAEPSHVSGLLLREFVVMPNHFHAIVEYHSPAARGGATATSHSGPAATKYSRSPDARDLPYVIGLYKSYTTNLYHRLKAAGRCIDIGSKLWQESFYDELIRDDGQYRKTAHYILRNPANWNSDRFGEVTTYAEGNLGLLQGDYIAYLSSEGRGDCGDRGDRASAARGGATATSGDRATAASGDRATAAGRFPATRWSSKPSESAATVATGPQPRAVARLPPVATGPQPRAVARLPPVATGPLRPVDRQLPVISSFTSFYERRLLARCLATGRRFIWVCPCGISSDALAKTAAARTAGLALLISPVAPGTGVNKQRANWCNQFIAKNAREIWVGHIRPGGSLESILKTCGDRPTARQ